MQSRSCKHKIIFLRGPPILSKCQRPFTGSTDAGEADRETGWAAKWSDGQLGRDPKVWAHLAHQVGTGALRRPPPPLVSPELLSESGSVASGDPDSESGLERGRGHRSERDVPTFEVNA